MIDHAMAAAAARHLLEAAGTAGGKPVLIVGDDADRSSTIAAMSDDMSATPVNLGVELSQVLIDAGGARIDLSAVIAGMRHDDPFLLLDRIQILMLPQLKVNALDTLVRVARRRPVCASWPGRLNRGRLRYADPNHPEWLDQDASPALILDLALHEGQHR